MAAHFGRRLRKGAATTALAAAAVAALTASQAPGVTADDAGRTATTGSQSTPDGSDDTASGNSHYYTDLPPLDSPTPSPSPSTTPGSGSGTVAAGAAEAGIPATVLDAYKKAAAALNTSQPGCNLPWQLLAAIGKVESGQARGGAVDAEGTTTSKILGPVLNGNGFASIKDTDNGVYDGDSTYDRAVGPMQFIPSTWAWAGRDGNGDGVKDPNNVYDAALAAADYLCRYDRDLDVQSDLNAAILSYNNSQDYLATVLSWLEYYRKGTHEVPDGTGTLPSEESNGGSGSGTGSNKGDGKDTDKGDSKDTGKGKDDDGKGATKPGGGTSTPSPTPPASPSPPATPAPTPTPTETVDHLTDAATGTLSAKTGATFDQAIAVQAQTKDDKAVAKVRVRFTITGDTDATFTGGESVATVATDSKGTATAPALVAGTKTGDFTVTAIVVGRSTVSALTYGATVVERQADALVRTTDTALTCTPGGEFADPVVVKATDQGAVADGVAATATLISSSLLPVVNTSGPYFKDADGNAVRTLTDLTTDKDGLLTLPQLYADDTAGTFLLRITTAGGATLDVELTVAAATS
ncbi:Lytic transglycosylase catalytic [Actinobacteria bacterium OK074]|nr:Lytic transglycosylase catalytic [Actinobacteria bacterium OK074]